MRRASPPTYMHKSTQTTPPPPEKRSPTSPLESLNQFLTTIESEYLDILLRIYADVQFGMLMVAGLVFMVGGVAWVVWLGLSYAVMALVHACA
jgi:hypothetical protein